MPIYTYECQSCGNSLEKRQSFTDDPLTEHEVCGGSLRRVIHPAGIVFKGSGFYNTDYKNSTASNKSAADSTDSSKPSESTSSESSTASTPASSSSGDSSSTPSTSSTSSSSSPSGSSTDSAKAAPAASTS